MYCTHIIHVIYKLMNDDAVCISAILAELFITFQTLFFSGQMDAALRHSG